ncbi:MAG: hypothetical protein ACSLFE_01280 [Gemmatimonadaceae bacterium]
MRLSGRLGGLLRAAFLPIGCEAPTGLDELSPRGSLIETHRAIVDGAMAGGPDSAAATLYAYARPPSYSTPAAGHADLMVRFLPASQDPPRTSVELRLAVF